MIYQKTLRVVSFCGVAATLLATAPRSNACGFLDCLFGGGRQMVYAPAAYSGAPAAGC
ncbi:hypothetical protein LCGC14_3118400, partial [marine sediment metagenome]